MMIFPTIDSYYLIIENILRSSQIQYESGEIYNFFILKKNKTIIHFYRGKIYLYYSIINTSLSLDLTSNLKELLNFFESESSE